MPHLLNRLLLCLLHRILRQPCRPFLPGVPIALSPILSAISPLISPHLLTAPFPPALPSRLSLNAIITFDVNITGFVNGLGVRMLIQLGWSVSCGAIFACIVGGGVFSENFVAVAVDTTSCR